MLYSQTGDKKKGRRSTKKKRGSLPGSQRKSVPGLIEKTQGQEIIKTLWGGGKEGGEDRKRGRTPWIEGKLVPPPERKGDTAGKVFSPGEALKVRREEKRGREKGGRKLPS